MKYPGDLVEMMMCIYDTPMLMEVNGGTLGKDFTLEGLRTVACVQARAIANLHDHGIPMAETTADLLFEASVAQSFCEKPASSLVTMKGDKTANNSSSRADLAERR